MKKMLALMLCVVLLLCSCSQKPMDSENIQKEYDLLDISGIDMYNEVIQNLYSGEISLVYSENPKSVKTTVYFNTLENGVKTILAEIKRSDSEIYNYYDGESLFVILNGEGTKMDSADIEREVLYRNFLGAPEDAINPDAIVESSAYLKKDKSEYLIVIYTDYESEGSMYLNLYLDENKNPKNITIYDTYTDEEGKERQETITLTYSKIGEEVTFSVPQFTLVSE